MCEAESECVKVYPNAQGQKKDSSDPVYEEKETERERERESESEREREQGCFPSP